MYLQLMYLQFHIYKNIPVSFDFITTWNQGVFLCSPCIWIGAVNRRKANWVGHVLRRDCHLKHVIEEKIKERSDGKMK